MIPVLGSKTEKILCLMIYETDSEISNLLVCKDPEHDMLVVGEYAREISSSLDKKKSKFRKSIPGFGHRPFLIWAYVVQPKPRYNVPNLGNVPGPPHLNNQHWPP